MLRQLDKPGSVLAAAAASADNLSLDGENSSDCGVVPSVPFIDRDRDQAIHIDNGGFNLIQDKSVLSGEESSLPVRNRVVMRFLKIKIERLTNLPLYP